MPNQFKISSPEWPSLRFRIAYYPEDQPRSTLNSEIKQPLYLASLTDRPSTDKRDAGELSWFLSVGNSKQYQDFQWTMDRENGAIIAA